MFPRPLGRNALNIIEVDVVPTALDDLAISFGAESFWKLDDAAPSAAPDSFADTLGYSAGTGLNNYTNGDPLTPQTAPFVLETASLASVQMNPITGGFPAINFRACKQAEGRDDCWFVVFVEYEYAAAPANGQSIFTVYDNAATSIAAIQTRSGAAMNAQGSVDQSNFGPFAFQAGINMIAISQQFTASTLSQMWVNGVLVTSRVQVGGKCLFNTSTRNQSNIEVGHWTTGGGVRLTTRAQVGYFGFGAFDQAEVDQMWALAQ